MKKMINDSALAVIAELHQEEKLCDVVIKVGGVEFNAHKIILCSCSSYFRWVGDLSKGEMSQTLHMSQQTGANVHNVWTKSENQNAK